VRAKAHSLLVQWPPVPLLVPPHLPGSIERDSNAQSDPRNTLGSGSQASEAPADAIEYILQAEVSDVPSGSTAAAAASKSSFVTVYTGTATHFRYDGYAWNDASVAEASTTQPHTETGRQRYRQGCLAPGTAVSFRVQARLTRSGLCSPSSHVAAFSTAAAGMQYTCHA
jgi:hypothetical protein